MSTRVRHISAFIDRPAAAVYEYAADPRNLPRWAAGLSAEITCVDDAWVAESPMGRVTVSFAPRNELGVLDHAVTLPSGETVHNPLRVIADGAGSEIVFTLRRRPGMSEEAFERDAAAVAEDLARLKGVLERQ